MTNTGLQKRLTERRKAFHKEVMQGTSLRDVVEEFAHTYNTTENALYQDWEQHEKWECIPHIDTTLAVEDALNKLDELRAMMWGKAKNAVSDSDQIKAIGKLIDIELKTIETYTKLGRVQQVNVFNTEALEITQIIMRVLDRYPDAPLGLKEDFATALLDADTGTEDDAND